MAESSPDAVVVHTEGRIIYANKAAAELLGADSPESLLGREALDFVHPDHREIVQSRIQRLLQDGQPALFTEHKLVRLDGKIVDVEWGGMPVVFQGKPAIQVVARDISARRRVRTQLEALQRLSQEITQELDLKAVLALVQRRSVELLDGHAGAVLLWDEAEQALVPYAWHGNEEWFREVRVRPGEGAWWWVFERGKGLIVNDYRSSPFAIAMPLARSPLTAVVSSPLLVHGKAIGVIAVDTDRPDRRFTEDDRTVLDLFARTAAIAIQNARLFADEQDRCQQLEAIRLISEEIARELDLKTVLRLIMQRAMALAEAEAGAIVLSDEQKGLLVPKAWIGYPEQVPQVSFRVGEGIIGRVASERRGRLVNDSRTSSLAHPAILEQTEITAVLAEPLIYQDRLLGVLVLDRAANRGRFTEGDQALLRLLANHASIAIENARLHEAVQVRARQLEMLNELARGMARRLEPAAVGREIMHAVQVLFPQSVARLWELNPRQRVLELVASNGMKDPADDTRRTLELGKGFAGLAAAAGEAITSQDVREDPRFLDQAMAVAEGLVSAAALPLMSGSELQGALVVLTRTRHDFTLDEIDLLRALAAQAAIAMESARLHESIRQRVRQLQTLNELTRNLSARLDPRKVVREVLSAVCVLFPSWVAHLWEASGRGAPLRLAGCTHQFEHGNRLELGWGQGLAGKAVASGEPVMSQDVSHDPHQTHAASERLASSVALPLTYGASIQGALAVFTRKPHDFTGEEIALLHALAAHAGIAMQNARLFQSAEEQRGQLRLLTSRLAEAEEQERRRLASELHDSVGQSLTALSLNLSLVAANESETAEARRNRLAECQRTVEETVERIREVMADLRPAVLDDCGLLAALRWYGKQFAKRTGLSVLVTGTDPKARSSPEVETALFRISQEALTNVAKHAEASRVVIRLMSMEDGLRLTIRDDGRGFDPADSGREEERRGWGLITMRERAAAVGGELRMESSPGQGTEIVVEIKG